MNARRQAHDLRVGGGSLAGGSQGGNSPYIVLCGPACVGEAIGAPTPRAEPTVSGPDRSGLAER
jgi:hypothetical protein